MPHYDETGLELEPLRLGRLKGGETRGPTRLLVGLLALLSGIVLGVLLGG